MRRGDAVNYYDQAGAQHDATINEVSGTGKSWYKILDLSVSRDGEHVDIEGVPHENDAEPGQAFWLEKGHRRKEHPEPKTVAKRSRK